MPETISVFPYVLDSSRLNPSRLSNSNHFMALEDDSVSSAPTPARGGSLKGYGKYISSGFSGNGGGRSRIAGCG